MEETTEQRKARLAALRQAKASGGPASTPVAPSAVPVAASTLGEKRKHEERERVFDERGDEVVDVEDLAEEGADDSKILKFRNYRPRDEGIEKQANLLDRAAPINVDEKVASILAQAQHAPTVRVASNQLPRHADFCMVFLSVSLHFYVLCCGHEQDPFTSVAPKKLNWDLKREVKEKEEQLRKRTQKAINEIVTEKMQLLEGEEEDEDDDGDDDDGQGAANAEEIDLD
jgi:hypothetical protein